MITTFYKSTVWLCIVCLMPFGMSQQQEEKKERAVSVSISSSAEHHKNCDHENSTCNATFYFTNNGKLLQNTQIQTGTTNQFPATLDETTAVSSVFYFDIDRQSSSDKNFSFTVRPQHGFLGIESVELTSELRTHFGAPSDAGIMVGRVTKDGPAYVAGFKVGDILTHLESHPIVNSGQLLKTLIASKPGDQLAARLWRDGTILETHVVLGEFVQNDLPNHLSPKGEILVATLGETHFELDHNDANRKGLLDWVRIKESESDTELKLELLQKKIEALEKLIMEKKAKENE